MAAKTSKSTPRWRRRKDKRPEEIVAAAGSLFAEHGFAATKLDAVADRAGIVRGSIYLYFETKETLFRAVVRAAVVPQIEVVRAMAESFDDPLAAILPKLLQGAASIMARPPIAAAARMVIGESRNFPDLAKIWHDEVVAPVLDALVGVIERGQGRGEVKPGDPRLHAFSVMGPLIMAMLFRAVFSQADARLPDLPSLAEQHTRCLLTGLSS